MFQNNNGAVVRHLATASMKHSRLKNRISGIVIALSACLLVASSVVTYNASNELSSRYSYHGVYRAVSKQVIAQLKSDSDIESVGIVKSIGTVKNGATSMKLTYSDLEAAKFYGLSVLDGVLPQNTNEIALEKDYLSTLGVQKKLGDIITLDFYNTETKQTKAVSFQISGFVEMPQTGQSKRTFFTGIVSKQFADAASDSNADVMIRIFNPYSDQRQKSKQHSWHLTPVTLGAMNLWRNPKRTALTLLSLSLAGVLFIAVFTLTNSIHVDKYVKILFPYGGEYQIAFNPNLLSANEKINILQADNPIDETLTKKILSIDGIDGVEEHKEIPIQITARSKNEEDSVIVNVTNSEAEKYKRFLLEGSIDYEAMTDSNSLLVNKRSWLTEAGFDFHAGDTIQFTIFDGNTSYQKSLTVAGVMDDSDLGAAFLMTGESMDSLVSMNCNSSLEVLSGQGYSEATNNQLKKLIEPYSVLYLDSFHANLERYQAVFHTSIMAIRAFIVLISCFGLINLINTMLTSLLARKKEFGLLRAMGMTNQQLLQMMISENFTLIIGTLLFAAPLGYGLGYLACKVAGGIGGTSYITYQFSPLSVLLIFAAMVLVQFVISGIAGRNFRLKSIMAVGQV